MRIATHSIDSNNGCPACQQVWRGLAIALVAAMAQGTTAQDLLRDEATAFQTAVQRVSQSVVQIEAFRTNASGGQLRGAGPTTGTVVSANGLVITSLNGLESTPTSILVTLPSGRRTPATLLARDFSRALVLLQIDVAGLSVPTEADPNKTQVGQWAIAVGKTLDPQVATRSVGIVSALGRAYDKAIQTDAKVSPINYGGPLVDIDGNVLGVLAPLSPGSFLQSDETELYDSGIGFAVPLTDIARRIEKMRRGEDIQRGLLGIVVKEQNELSGPVAITGSTPGSPAAKAGLQNGDKIIEAGGQTIEIYAHLKHALGPRDAGDSFPISVLRDGKRIDVVCQLAKDVPVYRKRQLGIHLAAPNAATAEASVKGREVRHVEPSSTAADAGIRSSDRILAIGNLPIANLEGIRELLAVAELDRAIPVSVARKGKTLALEVKPQEWSSRLPETLPPARFNATDTDATVTDLQLGNFPNAAQAIMPPATSKNLPGLLVVLAQPGEIDIEATRTFWNDFCIEYGWIVVVVQSKDPKAWSTEEIELPDRVVTAISQKTPLDKTRTVYAGIGVGGRLAIAAAANSQKATGVLTLGSGLGRFGIRAANRPGRSMDFLFVGKPDELTTAVENLRKVGYSAQSIPAVGPTENKWASYPEAPIQIWLEDLSKL